MSNLSDIYSALHSGKRAAESLLTWQTHRDGRESADNMLWAIEQGIKAYDRLSRDLKNGRKHVETPKMEPPTTCYCNATPFPPCSFCVSD